MVLVDMDGDHVCKSEKYNQNQIPGTPPIIVEPKLDIFDVTEVNEIDHSITIYFRFVAFWTDPGLSYRNITKM